MWISFSKKQHPYLQYFIREQQFIIILSYSLDMVKMLVTFVTKIILW